MYILHQLLQVKKPLAVNFKGGFLMSSHTLMVGVRWDDC